MYSSQGLVVLLFLNRNALDHSYFFKSFILILEPNISLIINQFWVCIKVKYLNNRYFEVAKFSHQFCSNSMLSGSQAIYYVGLFSFFYFISSGFSFYHFQPSIPLIMFLTLVQFSHSVVSDCLWPHESQHVRPPCPSPTPGVHPDSEVT